MKTTEIRKLIASSKQTSWFNSIEVTIHYPEIKFEQKIKGFSSIFKFYEQQINGWSKIELKKPNELIASERHFKQIQVRLESFITNYQNYEQSLDNVWQQEKNIIQTRENLFPYDDSATAFLLKLHNEIPENYLGAYHFIIGNPNFNGKNNINGGLMAYEFLNKESLITERKNVEKSTISSLKSDLRNQLSENETQITEHLANAINEYGEYVKQIDTFKVEKENLVENWFSKSKDDFSSFDTESKNKISDLEKTYREKLKLEEPAKYWSQRADKLKTQGWISFGALILIVFIVVFSLGELLWKTPEQIYTSFFEGDKSAAIRWSIIYITFISFMAFCVKSITKVMFSSFHLARDCEERHTLTYFYLSLLKDSKVDENDRKLIMQSLFSRAETGLLKDDSGPTMPNDIMTKIIGGK